MHSRKVHDFCYNEESGEIIIGREKFPRLKPEYDNDNKTIVDWKLYETYNPKNPLLSDPGDNVEETLRFLLKHAKDLGTRNLAGVVADSQVVCNRNFIKTVMNDKKWEYFLEKFDGKLFIRKNNSFKEILHNRQKKSLHNGLEFEDRLFDKNANWKAKSAVITEFSSENGKVTIFHTDQIDGVDSRNKTIEAKREQNTDPNKIWTQCKLGMIEFVLFGNCEKAKVTTLEKKRVDELKIDKQKAEDFNKDLVDIMNIILKGSSQLSEDKILIASCDYGEITTKIVDKSAENQVLSQEFKDYFQQASKPAKP